MPCFKKLEKKSAIVHYLAKVFELCWTKFVNDRFKHRKLLQLKRFLRKKTVRKVQLMSSLRSFQPMFSPFTLFSTVNFKTFRSLRIKSERFLSGQAKTNQILPFCPNVSDFLKRFSSRSTVVQHTHILPFRKFNWTSTHAQTHECTHTHTHLPQTFPFFLWQPPVNPAPWPSPYPHPTPPQPWLKIFGSFRPDFDIKYYLFQKRVDCNSIPNGI
jgi:hypothetical protein